jgi:hypothetical protein
MTWDHTGRYFLACWLCFLAGLHIERHGYLTAVILVFVAGWVWRQEVEARKVRIRLRQREAEWAAASRGEWVMGELRKDAELKRTTTSYKN